MDRLSVAGLEHDSRMEEQSNLKDVDNELLVTQRVRHINVFVTGMQVTRIFAVTVKKTD